MHENVQKHESLRLSFRETTRPLCSSKHKSGGSLTPLPPTALTSRLVHTNRFTAPKARPLGPLRFHKLPQPIRFYTAQILNQAHPVLRAIALIQALEPIARETLTTCAKPPSLPGPCFAILNFAHNPRLGLPTIIRPATGTLIATSQKRIAQATIDPARRNQSGRTQPPSYRFLCHSSHLTLAISNQIPQRIAASPDTNPASITCDLPQKFFQKPLTRPHVQRLNRSKPKSKLLMIKNFHPEPIHGSSPKNSTPLFLHLDSLCPSASLSLREKIKPVYEPTTSEAQSHDYIANHSLFRPSPPDFELSNPQI